MQKISESSVEVLYNKFDNLGKRFTEGFKRIETTEESIWSISSKWRGKFYIILSFCEVAISALALYNVEWSVIQNREDLLDLLQGTFNEINIGIISSVAVIWFLFHLRDVIVMGAYQYFQARNEERRQKREKYRQSVKEEGRQEEQERIQNQVDSLREKVASDEEVIRAI